MKRQPYPTDITDAQWAVLEPEIPAPRPGGRPRKTDMREVVNAIFYITHEGCTWRALPHDFPPWRTVYNYFDAWKRDGTWDRILEILRVRLRKAAGRDRPRLASPASTASRSRPPAAARRSAPTAARRSGAASAISSWIPWVCCWRWSSRPPTSMTPRRPQRLFAKMPSKDFSRLEEVQADNRYHSPELDRWLRVHHRGYEVVVVSREPGRTAVRAAEESLGSGTDVRLAGAISAVE